MKKTNVTLLVFMLCITCHSQIKVNEFGRTSIGHIYDFSNVQLNVGDSTHNSLSTILNGKAALFAHTRPINGHNFGIAAECLTDSSLSSTSHVSGVYGIAGCASGNWATGVSGRLAGSTNGAGVMGFSSTSTTGSLTSGKFAGYFVGNTFVSGSITAARILTPSDTRLKNDINYIGENGGRADILSKIMDVNVISYHLL